MPTLNLTELSGRHLKFRDREDIALLHARDFSSRQIARSILGQPDYHLSRFTAQHRHAGAQLEYRASVAKRNPEQMAGRPKSAKSAVNN